MLKQQHQEIISSGKAMLFFFFDFLGCGISPAVSDRLRGETELSMHPRACVGTQTRRQTFVAGNSVGKEPPVVPLNIPYTLSN